MSWKSLEQKTPLMPSMRSKMASAQVGTKIYVFGGLGAGPVNELWYFDLQAMRWTPIRSSQEEAHHTPAGRCGHTLTAGPGGKLLWLYGGQQGSSGKNMAKVGASTATVRVKMLERRNYLTDLCKGSRLHLDP